MFCDEPIVCVYLGQNETAYSDGANSFLDCFKELAYHVTAGYYIVLETENWALTFDVNGVSKEPSAALRERLGELFEDRVETLDPNNIPFVGFETTLFVGERLHKVTKEADHFLCEFDHFMFKVIPYALGTMDMGLYSGTLRGHLRMLGFDRYLKRKCKCGGDGEILLDWVDDYVVRCKNCKKSTRAEIVL